MDAKVYSKKKETDLYDFLGNLQLGMRLLEM